ncbi:MAG: hypothetical protein P8X50_14365, partial [Maritimibacter sp.]
SDFTVMVNWASNDRPLLDWVTATQNDVDHDEHDRLAAFTMTYEVEFQIAGTYALDVYGYVVAVGGFNLYKVQLTVDDDTDDTTGDEFRGGDRNCCFFLVLVHDPTLCPRLDITSS